MANQGEYFAVDEFNGDGYFNRRHLLKTHIVTAVMPDGQLAGAALFGPESVCRSEDIPNAKVYLFILPQYRTQGLGKLLYNQVETFIKR